MNKSKEDALRKKYLKFIETKEGKEWIKGWQDRMRSDSVGDFGDYLYDFYPEYLM